jgi:hypothetical protein
LRRGLPAQLPEQHCEPTVHVLPDGRHVVHAGLVAQPESLQSTRPSQSSSTPPVQTSGAPGWMLTSVVAVATAAHQPSPSASVQCVAPQLRGLVAVAPSRSRR